jgi:hypothetical protein
MQHNNINISSLAGRVSTQASLVMEEDIPAR